jgi:hypothetical protein
LSTTVKTKPSKMRLAVAKLTPCFSMLAAFLALSYANISNAL